MNIILFALSTIGGVDVVQLLIVAIVVGTIWYIFNLIPNIPPLIKKAVTVIACAVLGIYAIKFLAGLL